MTESIPLEIRFGAEKNGKKSNLTITELGVVLTAVNRAINKAAVAKLPNQRYTYSAQAKEPDLIVVDIVGVANGSVWMTLLLNFGASLAGKVLSTDFLASILANGATDTIKLLSKELKRAGQRIGRSAMVSTRIDPFIEENSAEGVSLEQPASALQLPVTEDASPKSSLASASVSIPGSKRISVTLTLPSGATATIHLDYEE